MMNKHLSLTRLRSPWTQAPRAIRYLPLCLCLALLNACASLVPEAMPQRQFVLAAATTPTPLSAQVRWPQLSVRVALNSGLDTNRLLMLSTDQELMPYHGARWALALPELVRERWAQALEQSKLTALSYAEGAKQGLRPAVVLHLRDFQAYLLGANRARCQVELVVEFLPALQQQSQSIHLSASREVATTDAASVAAGFNQAHEEVLAEALAWLAAQPVSAAAE